MPSQLPHRISKSEADEPKPLAYVRIYPRGRLKFSGYLAAAMAGGALALVAAAAFAVVSGALVRGG